MKVFLAQPAQTHWNDDRRIEVSEVTLIFSFVKEPVTLCLLLEKQQPDAPLHA